MQGKPTMYVIAGPEGAGKTTFYEHTMVAGSRVAPELRPTYISPDKVQDQMLGDKSNRAYGAGNLIADQQARTLIGERKSFVTETTFANERDLRLVADAKDAGYRVVIFQLQTKSAELSVARVAERVKEGGRDAPEAAVRADYARSPALIAQASQKADRTFVYDTSALNQEAKHVMSLERGKITSLSRDVPQWARDAYGPQLQVVRDGSISAAERSYRQVVDQAEKRTPGAHVAVAGHKAAEHTGPIVEHSAHHVLQQVGETQYVAHFKDRLAVTPELNRDQDLKIAYGADRDRGKIEFLSQDRTPRTPAQNAADAKEFLTKGRDAAMQNPRLEAAYAAKDALEKVVADVGPRTPQVRDQMHQDIRESIASKIAHGKPIEITRPLVDAVEYKVASRSVESAMKEKEARPDRQIAIEPAHRDILITRAEGIMRAVEGRVQTIQPMEQAHREARSIAARLGALDGAKMEAPFANKELASTYKQEQHKDQVAQRELQRNVSKGMDR